MSGAAGLGAFEAEFGHYLLNVSPAFFLLGGIAEQVSGVIGDHGFGAVIVVPSAAKIAHGTLGLEEALGGDPSEAANNLRGDDLQLLLENGQTAGHLGRSGVAVSGGSALEDVTDVDVVAGEAHAFGEDVVEELSGASDKGQALLVLIVTGGLADEDQSGVRIALAKNRVGAGPGEGALLAIEYLGLEGLEGLFFLLGSGLGKV